MREYVCGYVHCLHHGEKIKEEDAVIVGKRKFHKDCAEYKQYIDKMKDLYFDNIDKNAKYQEVLGVLNNIIFKKGVDPKFMIFAMEYIIRKKAKVKSPYVLHYLPENKLIQQLYNKERSKNI
jgi:hypothetical protein